jgi:hypothetical protein
MAYHHTKDELPSVSWYTLIGRLKRAYTDLTNEDLNFSEGQKDLMLESLGKKLKLKESEILNVMYRLNR